jgi:hypothetical protein
LNAVFLFGLLFVFGHLFGFLADGLYGFAYALDGASPAERADVGDLFEDVRPVGGQFFCQCRQLLVSEPGDSGHQRRRSSKSEQDGEGAWDPEALQAPNNRGEDEGQEGREGDGNQDWFRHIQEAADEAEHRELRSDAHAERMRSH